MCHASCVLFVAVHLDRQEVAGKRVLEVGSSNVNGGVRRLLESWQPSEYVGVDIAPGPGVDTVCPAEQLLARFGPDCFDVVISTEMLEHGRDWRAVISNMKAVLRPGGLLVLTTRSLGFEYHAYPHDYWRFEVDDMRSIFGDCEILALESDGMSPGVFLKAKKPLDFREVDLSRFELYSIVSGQRVREIRAEDFASPRFRSLVAVTRLAAWVRQARGAARSGRIGALLGWER